MATDSPVSLLQMLDLVWACAATSPNLSQVVSNFFQRVGATVCHQNYRRQSIIPCQDLSSPLPGRLVDKLHEPLGFLGFCLGKDPVSEVEYVTWLASYSAKDVLGPLRDQLVRGK